MRMAEPGLTRSLGPTAFLFVFNPTSPAARPRNEILGHAIGIACDYGALVVTPRRLRYFCHALLSPGIRLNGSLATSSPSSCGFKESAHNDMIAYR